MEVVQAQESRRKAAIPIVTAILNTLLVVIAAPLMKAQDAQSTIPLTEYFKIHRAVGASFNFDESLIAYS